MEDINSVVLTGELTHAPKLRRRRDGTPVTHLRLSFLGRAGLLERGRKLRVNFIDVILVGDRAEWAVENLPAGARIAVNGELEWWQPEDNGGREESNQLHRIVAQTVRMFGVDK